MRQGVKGRYAGALSNLVYLTVEISLALGAQAELLVEYEHLFHQVLAVADQQAGEEYLRNEAALQVLHDRILEHLEDPTLLSDFRNRYHEVFWVLPNDCEA